jgi:hypothetical protein
LDISYSHYRNYIVENPEKLKVCCGHYTHPFSKWHQRALNLDTGPPIFTSASSMSFPFIEQKFLSLARTTVA